MTLKLGENVSDKSDSRRAGMLIGVYENGFCKFRDKETKQVYTARTDNVERAFVAKGRAVRQRKTRERNGKREAELVASIPPERLAEVQRLADANGVSIGFTWRALNE